MWRAAGLSRLYAPWNTSKKHRLFYEGRCWFKNWLYALASGLGLLVAQGFAFHLHMKAVVPSFLKFVDDLRIVVGYHLNLIFFPQAVILVVNMEKSKVLRLYQQCLGLLREVVMLDIGFKLNEVVGVKQGELFGGGKFFRLFG